MTFYNKPIFILFFAILFQTVSAQQELERKVFITNEATINSEFLEYSPAFYEDGIVFVSTKSPSRKYKVKDTSIDKNIMSIFQAKRADSGLLEPPIPFAIELTTTVHEGPLSFSRTADDLFFTRNNYIKGKKKKAKDGIIKLEVFYAMNNGAGWSGVEALPFNDVESNACHPSISVEGDMLFFASDRLGGMGGMDIYVVYKQGDSWSEPINLGPEVNTEDEEVFPFVHADGTLYFASNGHAGHGGLDIFYTNSNGDSWEKSKNLGTPFNTENDDFGMIVDRDKKNGYLSSNRPGGFGEDDIYSFYIGNGTLDDVTGKTKEKETRAVQIHIIDIETADDIQDAKITYMNVDEFNVAKSLIDDDRSKLTTTDDEVIIRVPIENNGMTGFSDEEGKFPVLLNADNYIINVEKDGYFSRQIVYPSESDAMEFVISLEKGQDEPLETSTDNITNINEDVGNINASPTGTDSNSNSDNGTDTDNNNSSANEGSDTMGSPTYNANVNSDGTSDGTSNSSSDPIIPSLPSSIEEGTVFELKNIYYNFNDASIRPDAKTDLDALADFMLKYTDVEIELTSHTDSRGRTRYNRTLSQRRADKVLNYLSAKGVQRSRVTALGYGESELRNQCADGVDCGEQEHQYNRRTEVTVTKMSQPIKIKYVTNNVPLAGATNYTSAKGNYEYKVIAGVFSKFENAEKRLSKIRNLGFPDAQITSLGNSTSHYVVVKTFTDYDEARKLTKNLGSESVRSFIKKL